jgi:hypothetical protein
LPDALPDRQAGHSHRERVTRQLVGMLAEENPFAVQLCRLLSPAGQTYLACVEAVLKKPSNQDVMVELMCALEAYSAALPLEKQRKFDIAEVVHVSSELTGGADAGVDCMDGAAGQCLQALLQVLPDDERYIRAMLFLALLGEPVLDSVFSRTDAIGTVMRKKLQPVTEPIHEQIKILRDS